MRADLQRRGLIDDEHRLTEAGDAYCAALLERLPRVQAGPMPAGKRPARWDMRWPHER